MIIEYREVHNRLDRAEEKAELSGYRLSGKSDRIFAKLKSWVRNEGRKAVEQAWNK